MPTYRIRFEPAGVTVEVDPAMFPLGRHGEPGSILDIALAKGVAIDHACGGVGVCGSCHVLVTAGMDNLSEPTEEELDRVQLAPGSGLQSRLACQAIVHGDVTVTIPRSARGAAKDERS